MSIKAKKIYTIFKEANLNFRYGWGVEKIEKEVKTNPELLENERVLTWLGFLYDHLALRKKGKQKKACEDKAIRLYRKALKINPDSINAIWGIGRVWWHRNNKKALIYAFKTYRLHKKLRKGKGSSFAQNIGVIYETLGNERRAEYWLKRGLGEEKNNWGPYFNIIRFYRKIYTNFLVVC